MKKMLVIFSLCLLASACTETRVIKDNSVAAQFTSLNGRNGWTVTAPAADAEKAAAQKNIAPPPAGTPISSTFNNMNLKVTTSFRTDQPPGSPATGEPAPSTQPSVIPLMGGYMLTVPPPGEPAPPAPPATPKQ